jgi:glycosyltransferase involved in cell wall biosynthesis
LCEDVRFLGKQDAVEELLAVADLFMLPSESESFGLSALEAMACEVPVISSNTGGLPEVNIHGVTGFLSNIGDIEDMAKQSIRILQDEVLHQQMRKNALAHAQNFAIERILPQYEDYYQQILETARWSKNVLPQT